MEKCHKSKFKEEVKQNSNFSLQFFFCFWFYFLLTNILVIVFLIFWLNFLNVCFQGYKAPDKIDPKFLDPKCVFEDVEGEPKGQINLIHPEKVKK